MTVIVKCCGADSLPSPSIATTSKARSERKVLPILKMILPSPLTPNKSLAGVAPYYICNFPIIIAHQLHLVEGVGFLVILKVASSASYR